MPVVYLDFYKRKGSYFRLKHLLLVLCVVLPLMSLILPNKREKIGDYGRTHIIIKEIWPIFHFSQVDTVLRRHIKFVRVESTTCGENHIHVRETGSKSLLLPLLPRVNVTDPSMYRKGEKVKVYRSYYPDDEISIVEDRIPDQVFLINGKKVRSYRIERQK